MDAFPYIALAMATYPPYATERSDIDSEEPPEDLASVTTKCTWSWLSSNWNLCWRAIVNVFVGLLVAATVVVLIWVFGTHGYDGEGPTTRAQARAIPADLIFSAAPTSSSAQSVQLLQHGTTNCYLSFRNLSFTINTTHSHTYTAPQVTLV